MSSAIETVRRQIDAYRTQDREAAERLLDDSLRFTSPQDDGLDKASFLETCFPTASRFGRTETVELAEVSPGVVFARYVAQLENGEVFSNVERIVVRDGRIVEIRVYFGGRDAFPEEYDVPELEVDETIAPRPEEEIADVARAQPDVLREQRS